MRFTRELSTWPLVIATMAALSLWSCGSRQAAQEDIRAEEDAYARAQAEISAMATARPLYPAPDPYPGPQPAQAEEWPRIQFGPGRHNIDANQIGALEGILDRLGASPIALLSVCGHADAGGTGDKAYLLGMRRAMAVRDYLVREGLDPGLFVLSSHADSRPTLAGLAEVGALVQ